MVDPLHSLHPCQYYGWITAYHFKYVVESVAGQILDISMEQSVLKYLDAVRARKLNDAF